MDLRGLASATILYRGLESRTGAPRRYFDFFLVGLLKASLTFINLSFPSDKHIFERYNINAMAKDLKPKKKVMPVRASTTAQRRPGGRIIQSFPLLFSNENYKLIAIGCGLIALGLILMLGGNMKDPNVWDESVIYSFRRITLAPIVILAGLAFQVYAIFKK